MNEFSKGNYDCVWCHTQLSDLGKLLVIQWRDDAFDIHEKCIVDVVRRAQQGKEIGNLLRDWLNT